MYKDITIACSYEIIDDSVTIEDGEFSPITFRVSEKVHKLLTHSRDYLEVENYIMNKTDYSDLLLEKIEEEAQYISGDFMQLSITIDGVYNDEVLEKEITIINNAEELTFGFQDGIFIN
jgi:hypothetical protein